LRKLKPSNNAFSDILGDFSPTGIEVLDDVLGGGFPRSSLIILTGKPGTGKTIFGANFLYRGVVDYGEGGVYVSFVESREMFYKCMKALGVDLEGLENSGKFCFLDLLAVKEKAIPLLVDSIINEVCKVGAKRLVLDSYSALAQAFKSPFESRIFISTILSRLIRGMGCTILLIKETGGDEESFGTEEFVADGVIRFSATGIEGRRLRSLEILKLRGVRIEVPKLIFTLDGGFRVFRPFEFKFPERSESFQPPIDPPGKYSTGLNEMDNILGGGMPESSFMILECDERIPIIIVPLLVHSMTASFLLKGRGVIIAPSSGINYASLSEFLKLYGVTSEHCMRSLRVIVLGRTVETEKPSEYEITLSGDDWKKDMEYVQKAFGKFIFEAGRPILLFVCAATLASLYGDEKCLEILRSVAAQTKNGRALLIAIVGAGYRDLAIKLSLLSDFYLRLVSKYGCPILYGVKPTTPLYAVEVDASKGYPKAKLTPII